MDYDRVCKTCRHWKDMAISRRQVCRRYPKQAVVAAGTSLRWEYPAMNAHETCGEWTQIEEIE